VTEYKTPHVHEAIAAILKSLSVEKGGVLPGNMGGKPYITAADAAAEVKRKFVDNDLIFLPNETIYQHKEVVNKDRINVLISVTGHYTIVSTRDGSSVTVSGTGDGLAGGTAVASNIASTNALKNAMLRLFLITEQSVEDAAKNGDEPRESAVAKKIQRAASTAPPATAAARVASDPPSKKEIRTEWIEKNRIGKQEVIDHYNKVQKAGNLDVAAAYDKVLADLKSGELKPKS
jgi:hypothetical protein